MDATQRGGPWWLYRALGTVFSTLMLITEIKQTSDAFPSQWEGRLADGRPFYIRYRGGYLMVRFGPVGGSFDDALNTDNWFDQKVGADLDEKIELVEVCRLTGLALPSLD